MKKVDIISIIGKKVVDVRGSVSKYDKRCKYRDVDPEYILFNDGKTVLYLEEQDHYTYHDYSSLARELNFKIDKELWNRIKKDKKLYPKATEDIGF